MDTPKLLLKPSRPPLSSTKLIESLIANKKPLYPHPTPPRSHSIRALRTSLPKSERSSSESRKFILNTSYPIISAASWCVVEGNTGRVLYGFKDLDIKEIASLSKIMTCYLCLKLIEDGLASFEDTVKITKKAQNIPGTSAELKENDQLCVLDLLYGLMLPSGNDAAWALAEHFGKIISFTTSKPVKIFVSEMNKMTRVIGLSTTYFANPHGLIYKKNVSCARDVCKLSSIAMKNQFFRKIVNTKIHNAEILNSGISRKVTWENTNKLLLKGFEGIKTGITENAGPCLSAAFRGYMYIIITLLNSRTMEARWEEAQTIATWIMNSCN